MLDEWLEVLAQKHMVERAALGLVGCSEHTTGAGLLRCGFGVNPGDKTVDVGPKVLPRLQHALERVVIDALGIVPNLHQACERADKGVFDFVDLGLCQALQVAESFKLVA